jgi:CheY-like chemotaxis protein
MSACAGKTALVVEDEAVISMLIEDVLADLGCTDATTIATLQGGLAYLASRKPDFAVLDVNLAGTPSWPIAEALEKAGAPFIFTTGYGAQGVPAQYAGRPVVQKPFTEADIAAALTRLCGG